MAFLFPESSGQLAFPGYLTPPDIPAYQQFSSQLTSLLPSANRIRTQPKNAKLLLGGIDGRLNPEAFYFKSKSANRKRVEPAEPSGMDLLVDPFLARALSKHDFFSSQGIQVSHPICPQILLKEREEWPQDFLFLSKPIGLQTSAGLSQQAHAAFIDRRESPQSSTFFTSHKISLQRRMDPIGWRQLSLTPNLLTWTLARAEIEKLVSGELTWREIYAKSKSERSREDEIECFYRLYPVQKHVGLSYFVVFIGIDAFFWGFKARVSRGRESSTWTIPRREFDGRIENSSLH